MVRTLPFLGLFAALAVVFPVVGGATPAHALANSVTFQDSRGEDPQGPDINTITVSNDNSGLITWKIDIPNQAQLSGSVITEITIDADARVSAAMRRIEAKVCTTIGTGET